MVTARSIQVTVNGASHIENVEPRLLLVHFLRDVLRLTGTHIGCDTSQCGACTISLDGLAVKSCTLFAVQADKREIVTIEGLAGEGPLHPLQEAFHEEHGLQCGFCTPGMIMSLQSLLEQDSRPSDDDVRHAIAGNICRCTGYHNIVKAAQDAARRLRGEATVATGSQGQAR